MSEAISRGTSRGMRRWYRRVPRCSCNRYLVTAERREKGICARCEKPRRRKILSFSAVEILPSLLDRTKTQTIRPLWKEIKGSPAQYSHTVSINEPIKLYRDIEVLKIMDNSFLIKKEPRFKVGEKIQILWKCRSKAKWFYRGNGLECPDFVLDKHDKETEIFSKLLGTGEITEVFEIELSKMQGSMNIDMKLPKDKNFFDISTQDGFKNQIDMFTWFDKKYDLSNITRYRFIVYRWKWL